MLRSTFGSVTEPVVMLQALTNTITASLTKPQLWYVGYGIPTLHTYEEKQQTSFTLKIIMDVV